MENYRREQVFSFLDNHLKYEVAMKMNYGAVGKVFFLKEQD